MNLSPRNKLILVVVAAVVVVVALAAVLIFPTYSRIGDLNGQMDTAVKEFEAARTLLEQRYQVKNQAAQTDARLIELAVAVPENPDLPSLIIDLEDTAYEAGVVLRSVRPQPPISPDAAAAFVGLPVELEVWGTWADMVDFVDRLERLPRQVRINSFNATVMTEPSEEEIAKSGLTFPPYYQVRCSLKLTAYVIPAGSKDSTASVPAVTP